MINISLKKIYLLLILNFCLILFFINKANTTEKIGTIVNLKNEVVAINAVGEKRILDLYDEIFLKDKVITNDLSTVTIDYIDYSTIIVKETSSFEVTEFDILSLDKIYLGKVDLGSVIIESGMIAKEDNGSMIIELPTMSLDIKGTRFNVNIKPNGTSEVSLAKDSFGNVGSINILAEGESKTLFNIEQVVSVNNTTGLSERPKTDDEMQELIEVSNDFVESNSIDEALIQSKLTEKLVNGELVDVNNDGIIDDNDFDIYRDNIKFGKQEKINFLVDYSSSENSEFLSNVLNFSDPGSIGQSMEMILETGDDYLISAVVTNLASKDNLFLTNQIWTGSDLEENNEIKEKIFTQMLNVSDNEINNAEIIGEIISKSDVANVDLMIETIQAVNETIADSTITLEVLSSMADNDTLNMIEFSDEGQDLFDEMMEDAVYMAAESEDGGAMLASVITNGDAESVSFIMDTIVDVSDTVLDSTLALEVLSSMAETDEFDDVEFNDEGQDLFDEMMEDAVYMAAENDDGAEMLASIITNSDSSMAETMFETISDISLNDPNSTLVAQVLSSVVSTETFDNSYLDDDQMNQIYDLVDTIAYTNPENNTTNTSTDTEDNDNIYDAEGFGIVPPYYHRDTGTEYNPEGFDKFGNTDTATDEEDYDDSYDTEGFSMVPPYYHRDTGTLYNMDGLDKYGNTEDSGDDTYDDEGFSMVPPYYHRDTGTEYNPEGFDKYGNSEDGGDSVSYPTWVMEPTFSASYTTSDNISVTANAESTPAANGVDYSATGLPGGVTIDSISGDITGTPNETGTFSVMVTATDSVEPTYQISTATFTFSVSSGEGGEVVTWNTTSADFPSTLTVDDPISSISLSATGVGTISYTYTGTFPDGIELIAGIVSGTPSTAAQPATSVTFTATDEDGNDENLVVSFPLVNDSSGGDNPTWVTQPTFNAEYELNDNINVPAEAESSPAANGIDYSATGLPDGVSIDSISGDITGTFQMAGNYSVIITATDSVEPTYQISTSSFSIDVIEYDEKGFNTSSPYFHRDTGTLYDNDGYNSAGFNSSGYNAANEYDPAYDEEASEA